MELCGLATVPPQQPFDPLRRPNAHSGNARTKPDHSPQRGVTHRCMEGHACTLDAQQAVRVRQMVADGHEQLVRQCLETST